MNEIEIHRYLGHHDNWRNLVEVHETELQVILIFEFIEGKSLT